MAIINQATKELQVKIVYYGPAMCGKTTNLVQVHDHVQTAAGSKGKLVSLATSSDRTLFFDFLPIEAMSIKGFKTKFQLYTVPGQVIYNTTRQLVLRGVDGIVFVADSQYEKMTENVESLQNLADNLKALKLNLDDIPYVLQYNKRDLPNAAPVKDLQAALNPGWAVTDPARQKAIPDPVFAGDFLVQQLPDGEGVERAPAHEAVAVTGDGVFETLKAVSKLVLKSLG